jgi:hypothetical protein
VAAASGALVLILVAAYLVVGGRHVKQVNGATSIPKAAAPAAPVSTVPVTTVPVTTVPSAKEFSFSKAVVWQSDAITDSTGGFDTSNPTIVAALTRDALDMQGAGVKWARWWVGPGYSIAQVSTVASIFRAHGVILILDVNSGTDSDPASERVLERWLSALVPAMAKLGEHYWEIGNEPNIDYRAGGYWNDCAAGVTPSTTSNQANIVRAVDSYVLRLKDAYTTIHRADGLAYVSSAGLSYDDYYSKFCELTSDQWIAQFTKTGAWRYMDCFGIHPYAGDPAGVVAALAETRSDLSVNPEYARIPFCITELGFKSTDVLTENERAREYVTLMNDLKNYGIKTPVFWYDWYDYNTDGGGYGITEFRGLTSRGYLPIYSAVRAYKP